MTYTHPSALRILLTNTGQGETMFAGDNMNPVPFEAVRFEIAAGPISAGQRLCRTEEGFARAMADGESVASLGIAITTVLAGEFVSYQTDQPK